MIREITTMDRKTGEAKKVPIDLTNGIDRAILQIFRALAPTRTGVLKGTVRVELTAVGFNIISDIYYMPYTTERWISPRWKGRENPNLRWWDEAYETSMRFLSSIYGKEFRRVQ
jgi:hypothetical protein